MIDRETVWKMDNITKTDGSVTAAKGFKAAGVAAGIKYTDRKDLAMIFSEAPATVAGMFTSNVVKAAPVKYDMEVVQNSPYVQAVIVNSGIANAATSTQGMEVCRKTAEHASKVLGIPETAVLIGSTGVIGEQIPMDKVTAGIDILAKQLSDTRQAAADAEAAIMTTDTVPKEVSVTFSIGGKTVTIGGMSKGSGMIHPNMCTMLAYICTDCDISKEMLDLAAKTDIPDTFNMISVDGDTSTNDTLLVLANGEAANAVISEAKGPAYEALYEALYTICRDLAMQMAGDGEGATKLIEVNVEGMDTVANARILAKSVICSSLTKAAVYGRDANWGRILCALGYAGVDFDPGDLQLYFVDGDKTMLIFTEGAAADYSEEEATELLKKEKVTILARFHMGEASATAWGCDLTYDYVKINADYRS